MAKKLEACILTLDIGHESPGYLQVLLPVLHSEGVVPAAAADVSRQHHRRV